MLEGGSGITIDSVTILDSPGRNDIMARGDGDGLTIRDSLFRNGGTSLSGNGQNDFSTTYVTFTNASVTNCHIEGNTLTGISKTTCGAQADLLTVVP